MKIVSKITKKVFRETETETFQRILEDFSKWKPPRLGVGINIVIVIKICRNQGYKEWRSKSSEKLHFPAVSDRRPHFVRRLPHPGFHVASQSPGDPKPSIKDLHNRLYQRPVFDR